MKKQVFSVFLLAAIFCSGMFFMFATNSATTSLRAVEDTSEYQLEAKILGDLEGTISLPVSPLGITYLDGVLWMVSRIGKNLYKVNPVTGTEIAHYSLGFEPVGLTTDGTSLYISVEETSTVNGTIFKVKTDGTIISSIEVPITSQYMSGLAWDGSYLWAAQEVPNALLRINPKTGTVLDNFTIAEDPSGICYYDGLIWGVIWNENKIYAYDPTDGRIREVFNNPGASVGEYGITYNGTHFLHASWNSIELYALDIPTAAGEVWNVYDTPILTIDGIDWNGTHYFTVDSQYDKLYVLHDGTFEIEGNYSLPFQPLAIAVIGDYLFISQSPVPCHIFKYTFTGTQVAEYSAVGVQIQGLTYDGTYLWGNGADNKIYKMNPADCTEINSTSVANYADLAWDNKNNVFWAVHQVDSRIYQLDPTTLLQTGVYINCTHTAGEYGIVFNGKHLVHTNWDSDRIYKFIIDLPSKGGIPGFAHFVLLFSVLSLISVFFLLKRNNRYWRQI
ncbi:MAG: hypothetical protein ACTSQ8_13250 [Candidatus Helarchaeota archaeon]